MGKPSVSNPRLPVRLGKHGTAYVFEEAVGLHEKVMGLAVATVDAHDPEVFFEEHGLGIVCPYFELQNDDVTLNERLGPAIDDMGRDERAASHHWPTKIHAHQAKFSLDGPARVNAMLANLRNEVVADGGGVFIIRASKRLERRKAMIRVLHAAQAQPDRALNVLVGEPQPLQNHSAQGHHHLYAPALLLSAPFVRGFTASRIVPEASEAYALVVLYPPGKGAPLNPNEAGWTHVFHDGLPSLRRNQLAGGTRWVKELNLPATNLPAQALIRWWSRQLDALYTEATDLGRYRAVDGVLDARNAYRELRTLDRIFVNCVRIQANVNDHVGRVAAAFEFFDLLPNLLPAQYEPRRIWAALGNPRSAAKTLNGAFADAPEPIKSVLIERVDKVTSKLREETIDTVVPGRFVRGAVQVGRTRKPINPDPYVAKILNQLRNTHHGYQLQDESQRDLLDTHTGHIGVAFPELVVLYVLAIVADRPARSTASGSGSGSRRPNPSLRPYPDAPWSEPGA